MRLRPILMTSLATILGLIPMALALEAGSEQYAPLARAIIGGLRVSVVVTVFLVPAATCYASQRRNGSRRGGAMRTPVALHGRRVVLVSGLRAGRTEADAQTGRDHRHRQSSADQSGVFHRRCGLAGDHRSPLGRLSRSGRHFTGVKAENGTRLAAGALNNPLIFDRFASGLAVGQLITDFGRTHRLSQSAGLHASAERAGVVVTRADVLLPVDQAYFRTLKAQAVLTVAQQTVQERQTVTDRVTALAQAKLKSGLDVTFAEVNLGQAKLLLVQAQNEIKAAYAELARRSATRTTRVRTGDEPLPPPPPTDVLPLVAQAFRERPELVRQKFIAQSAHAFALAERDLSFPTISAAGNFGLVPVGDPTFRSSYAAGGFNVTIPVFNGKLFTARYSEANLRNQAEDQRLLDLENIVAREVRVAWLDVITAYQRLDLTSQILAQATGA